MKKLGPMKTVAFPSMPGQHNTYHRNSLEEFFEERLLSIFHFLLPFLSGFSSSHLSNGEPMVTGDNDKISNNKINKNTSSQNRLS